MSPPDATELLLAALRLVAVLSAPLLLAALVAGIVSGVVQAFTSWSDAALTHVPRVLAVAAAWLLAGPWVTREVLRFARLAWGGEP